MVVSLEQAVAAPLCSCLLANAGARVVKVERNEGDFARAYDHVVHGESAYFVWLNAGKESIRVDLGDEADRLLLSRLVAAADVFIQNLSPGAAARRGFASDTLREAHPRLITVDISGYGETGDFSRMKAYDLLIQGESGLASVTGSPGSPGRVGVSICDIACGTYAHSAVLEALLLRARTGTGSAVKVSLFDAAANWMTVPLLHYDYGGVQPPRGGLSHPSIAPYGAFECEDGRLLLIAVQNEREWKDFCEMVLREPHLAIYAPFVTNIDRVENRAALDTSIAAALRQLDFAALVERLDGAKIAWGRVNAVAELSTHPQLRRTRIQSPSGYVDVVADPVRHSSWQPSVARCPALGEHDESIRREFSAYNRA